MKGWVLEALPIVRIRIGFRHVVIVGDASGLKRVFQVRSVAVGSEPVDPGRI